MQRVKPEMFFEHPMNRLMVTKGVLPAYNPQELALKYISLAQSGMNPTEEQLEMIRTNVMRSCKDERDVAGVEKTWPEMHDRLGASLGLTQLMLDHGMYAPYFYQYLVNTGKGRFAVALEAKDGLVMPPSGEMKFMRIPDDDWCQVVNVEEPSHPARRQTDWCCQSIIRNAKMIFEAGAGLLPGYRNYNYPLGRNGQKIVACDFDPEMSVYLPLVFEKDLRHYGIEYIVGDLMQVMDNPEYFGKFDVVRMTGLLSYYPDNCDKLEIMRKAQRLLKPDGVIITDLWVMGPSLIRTALTRLWPIDPTAAVRLTPEENNAKAIAVMDDMCKELGLPYVYMEDSCNGNPLCYTQVNAVSKCVMFLVGRNVSGDMFDRVDYSLVA